MMHLYYFSPFTQRNNWKDLLLLSSFFCFILFWRVGDFF